MANSSVGQIDLNLNLNQQAFNRQINNISKNTNNIMSKTFSKVGKMVAGALAIGAVVNFGKSCIEFGSNLQEVQNVVDTVFPTMSEKVDEFSKNSIKQLGMSETAYKKNISTSGAMAKSFGYSEEEAFKMAKAITEASADVGSFFNMSQSEASTKLKSIFTGETESLKDLGVVMTQNALDQYALRKGFNKTTSEMSEQEKVALRYNFVLETLNYTQGDFAKTSGNWAGQIKILSGNWEQFKATIGQSLINVFTPLLTMLNSLLEKINSLSTSFLNFSNISGTNNSSKQISEVAAAANVASENVEDIGTNANKTSKILKKSLMGFDKLNQLLSPNNNTTNNTNIKTEETKKENKKEKNKEGDLGGLSKILDTIKGKLSMFKQIDLSNLISSFNTLKEAIAPIGQSLFDGLSWAWDNLLIPLSGWVIEDAIPAFFNLFSAALSVFNSILTALKPLGIWLWNNFLQPIAQWTGGVIISVLETLTDILYKVSDWINKNQPIVETLAIIIGSFAAAWGLVTAAMTIWNGVAAITTGITTALSGAIAFLTSPIGIVIAIVGALIAIGTLLYKNWDLIKQKASEIGQALGNAFRGAYNVVKSIFGSIINVIKAPINFIISMINGVINSINKLSIDVPDWVPGVGGETLGFSIPNIPALAQGGYVRKNQPQLAMIGDNRQHGEIVSPENKMADVFSSVLDKYFGNLSSNTKGSNDTITIENIVTLDGKILYREQKKTSNNERRRTNKGQFK